MNRIRDFKILWSNFIIIVTASFRLVIRSWFGKLNRTQTSYCLRRTSKKILDKVHTTYDVNYLKPINWLKHRPYIFMSNHQSAYDIPLILAAIPGDVRLFVKHELFKIPVFGRATRVAENISIDRRRPEKAIASFVDAKNKLVNGLRLWAFPEGTRSIDGKLLPFKLGAFRLARELKAFIIPVALLGTRNILPAKSSRFGPDNQHLTINIGEPIDAEQYDVSQQKQLMDKVKQAIQQLMHKQG